MHQTYEPDPNDPPLPSYSALMASESNGINQTSQSFEHRAPTHHRSPSIEHPPYPPVDYGLPNPHQLPSQPHHAYDNYSPQSANPQRVSAGSVRRRSIPDVNDLDLSEMTMQAPMPHGIARHQTAPTEHQYANWGPPPPRQRAGPGGYSGGGADGDATASVYSLDSGMGAYDGGAGAQQYPVAGPPYAGQGYAARPDFSNPYYSAASEFLGLPPGAASSSTNTLLARQHSTASLARTNTSVSGMSSASTPSLVRKPTESLGASSTRRRGMQAAVDLNKPPYTKQYVDDYRKRMKDDPDSEAQYAFAKYLIEAAKKLGDELSQNDPRLGRKYRDVLLQESLRNIKKLAEGKEPYADAQFFLANLYGTGQLGLQVDHEKAYYLYLMASKLNHPAATYRSAVCNEIGAGTKKDPNRAVLFYRKAVALGDTAAMYKLSMILLGGLLLSPRNPREAIVWLRRAATQADEDNPHALHELALLHERPNNGGVVPNDPNVARDLFTQAAGLGYAPAQFKLGSCHEFGTLGCPIDPRRSIAWYTRAAEKGDSEAELALSGWYLTGSGGFSSSRREIWLMWEDQRAEYAEGCEWKI